MRVSPKKIIKFSTRGEISPRGEFTPATCNHPLKLGEIFRGEGAIFSWAIFLPPSYRGGTVQLIIYHLFFFHFYAAKSCIERNTEASQFIKIKPGVTSLGKRVEIDEESFSKFSLTVGEEVSIPGPSEKTQVILNF